MPIPPLCNPIFDTRRSPPAPAPPGRRAYDTPGINDFVQADKGPVLHDDGKLSLESLASIHKTRFPEDPDKTAILKWDRLSTKEKIDVLDRILYLLNSNDIGVFRLAPITHESDGVVVINTLCSVLAEAKNNIHVMAAENSVYHERHCLSPMLLFVRPYSQWFVICVECQTSRQVRVG